MTLRLFFFRLILSCVLLGAQQMGYAHALSHLRASTGAGDVAKSAGRSGSGANGANGSLQADKACEQCLAFAQIDAMLGGADSGSLADISLAVDRPHLLQPGLLPVTACAFQSRAPPGFL